MMLNQIKISIILLILLTVTTGVLYPLFITGVAQILFPVEANGSLIKENGKTFGSELIGQQFTHPSYFRSRPSATSSFPYNASASSGSNLGPLNSSLLAGIQMKINALKKINNLNRVPVDLVTASGSGLDPHISIASAVYQISSVAHYRSVSANTLDTLVRQYTEGRQFGILGEPRVNVLKLNLALDKRYPVSEKR